MDADSQLFFNRLGQLPVVKATSQKALSVYEGAKKSNRLISATLQLAEGSVKYATQIHAVKKVLDSQLVAVANKVAVTGLDKVEHSYPIVKKTPEELWAVGTDYYEHSYLKGGVDLVYSAKDYGFEKVSNTKKFYLKLVSDNLDRLLDLSDMVVDKYVAIQGEPNGQPAHCSTNDSYFNRVNCISGKFYRGVKYRAGEKYDASKQYALQALGDLHTAMLLIEYAKNTAAWMNEKTHTGLTAAQEQAKVLWQEIQRRAEPVSGRSEVMVLTLVKGLAANVASLSQMVAKHSMPYLPEGLEKTVAASAAYATDLSDTFAKAKTLGDLRDEVMTEAKQKFAYVQDGLTKGIDYLVEVPPVSWLVPGRNRAMDSDGHENTQNGFVPGIANSEH